MRKILQHSQAVKWSTWRLCRKPGMWTQSVVIMESDRWKDKGEDQLLTSVPVELFWDAKEGSSITSGPLREASELCSPASMFALSLTDTHSRSEQNDYNEGGKLKGPDFLLFTSHSWPDSTESLLYLLTNAPWISIFTLIRMVWYFPVTLSDTRTYTCAHTSSHLYLCCLLLTIALPRYLT